MAAALPTFSAETSADDVASVFADQIKGKNVLVTGTSLNGLGFETARVIAKYANLVIITGYNEERLKLSEDAIMKETPAANVRRLILDLNSFASVRQAAAEVNSYVEPLHVLIHNAVTHFGSTIAFSKDGLDTQWSAAHVGPFLFTKLLAPKLLAAGTPEYTPRVVFVSSAAHELTKGIDFGAIVHPPSEGEYNGLDVYAQIKSANVLMGIELSRRSGNKLLGFSLHPGGASESVSLAARLAYKGTVIFTNTHTDPVIVPTLKAMNNLTEDGKPNLEAFQWKTLGQGAATTVAAAFDTRLIATPGAYLEDATLATDKIAPHAKDPANGKKLWTVTEQILGEKFEF